MQLSFPKAVADPFTKWPVKTVPTSFQTMMFDSGIRDTVRWYLENLDWCERVGADGISRCRAGLSGAGRLAA